MNRPPAAARMRPPSTAAVPVPGRVPHWIRPNHTERVPARWMTADTETHRIPTRDGEEQRFRLAAAQFWRTDLKTGDAAERRRFTRPDDLWEWALGNCHPGGRTCLAFHNASFDLAISQAFTILPSLGATLAWCNLDRDVSVATWRTPGGTLIIWDTWTWCPTSLAKIGAMLGLTKPALPAEEDTQAAWFARCEADVDITTACVKDLLHYVTREHLGNWQPSGAGMGHSTWRHRFYTHKVLVHDDQAAVEAEREAMHTGRAEAWWHGRPTGGPYTEWDMHMSYCRIAAECLLPGKLWDYDPAPTPRIHQWALEHWRTLARVQVTTPAPAVPARHDGRIIWPVGTFTTVLWDTELAALTAAGGHYKVIGQWRYTRKPVLREWAQWSIQQCALPDGAISPLQRTWVKHQSRAVIGRLALRTPSWEPYSDNWMPGYTGISWLTEPGKPAHRLMHVGGQVWEETSRAETRQSVPQITSWIMAEARTRLWNATLAAGQQNVLHTDTDSLIVNHNGDQALEAAAAAGLPGTWRRKDTWRTLSITGPRHYRTPSRKQVPGVPRSAAETPAGTFHGEVWGTLAEALTEGRDGTIHVRHREWQPTHTDHRRPYQGETDGPAEPIRLDGHETENHVTQNNLAE